MRFWETLITQSQNLYPRLPELRGINDGNNENVNKIIAPGFVFCHLYRWNVSLPGQLFIWMQKTIKLRGQRLNYNWVKHV